MEAYFLIGLKPQRMSVCEEVCVFLLKAEEVERGSFVTITEQKHIFQRRASLNSQQLFPPSGQSVTIS